MYYFDSNTFLHVSVFLSRSPFVTQPSLGASLAVEKLSFVEASLDLENVYLCELKSILFSRTKFNHFWCNKT